MRCVEKEPKEIHGGGNKRQRRQHQEKDAHKVMCRNINETNKSRHKSVKQRKDEGLIVENLKKENE